MNENDTSDPPLTEVLGRLERDGDAVSVDFDRLFATDAADLWQICTDPGRLARWFAPVSGGLRPGGSFVIHFDDDDTRGVGSWRASPRRASSGNGRSAISQPWSASP